MRGNHAPWRAAVAPGTITCSGLRMYDASAVRTASGYVAENASVWRRGGKDAKICLESNPTATINALTRPGCSS